MSDEAASPPSNYKCTPPTNRKVRNPFDKALIGSLHNPICSPGMCKIYKKQNNGLFRWDIDQACTLAPADIVPCNSQFEPSPDPALEKIAEEANEKFFSQEMVMPSPLESSKKVKQLQTSYDSIVQITTSIKEESVATRDFAAQTVLTLPPELPPELEKILQTYCTFTQEQDISGDYEITANGSLRRKLLFEEHSDMEHYDSEQTDDEIHIEQGPSSSYETHTPVVFSPDLSENAILKGMKRTFGTPLKKGSSAKSKGYRNKILDVVDMGEPCFSPIQFHTPPRLDKGSTASSSLASTSISPVNKVASSDEEKNNFTSPESDAMATCLDCINSDPKCGKKGSCFCKDTPDKSVLRRSMSLKESPPRQRKGSLSDKRSLSMSSLHRSRSVQKLDFSMDMSLDGSGYNHSQDDAEISPLAHEGQSWSIVEESSIQQLLKKVDSKIVTQEIQSSTQIYREHTLMEETPIKGKSKSNILTHEISKIRTSQAVSPLNMSLDSSLDCDNLPNLEDKQVDFNAVDLKYLTENISQFNYTANVTKTVSDCSTSFKKVDSGFNENTFYANASSYYESAIKPSELTVTSVCKSSGGKTALKEISNVNWMRVDSGFKDETSADNVQFYVSENSMKETTSFAFPEAKLEEKENDFDKYFMRSAAAPQRNEAMSMSDIFNDDVAFNCNFSSTPSKNKTRKFNL